MKQHLQVIAEVAASVDAASYSRNRGNTLYYNRNGGLTDVCSSVKVQILN